MTGVPTPLKRVKTRLHIWRKIRELKRFTLTDLEAATECHRDSCRDYVKQLLAVEIVTIEGEAPMKAGAYRLGKRSKNCAAPVYILANDQGIIAPRFDQHGVLQIGGSVYENLWRTMKILKVFSAAELSLSAATEEFPAVEKTADSYCRELCRAGYLSVHTFGSRSKKTPRKTSWRLIPGAMTGPQAPRVMDAKAIFDPNLEAIVSIEVGAKL